LPYYTYTPTGVESKVYYPDIDLGTWDLESKGSEWQFIVSEKDANTTETRTGTLTTEFATNFGLTAGGYQGKIGLSFGTSAKRTQTNTYTLTTTLGSDDLGTVECYFSDPVISSNSPNSLTVLFFRNNPYVELTVIPVSINSNVSTR